MILKIPCHWVLWLKFIAVITDIMACWVARYYRQRSEGKKELVIDDYKIVSDWDSCALDQDQTFRSADNYKAITSPSPPPQGGSFIKSQPAHRWCLYLRSKTLTLKTLCLSSKWQLSSLRPGGGEGSEENIINTFLLSVPLYPASAGL